MKLFREFMLRPAKRSSNTYGRLRIVTGIIGLVMFVTVLFSFFYVAVETDHDCCGDDCPICACIRQCEDTLHGIGIGIAAVSGALAPIIIIFFAAVFIIDAFHHTLISRKVRLNN